MISPAFASALPLLSSFSPTTALFSPVRPPLLRKTLHTANPSHRHSPSISTIPFCSAQSSTHAAASASPPAASTSSATSCPLDSLLNPSTQRFIFVGGKGGVGKTTTAAALGVHFARAGLCTLLISTDPAHSLGDALRLDLSTGTLTSVADHLPLHAIEIDTAAAVVRFRELLSHLNDAPQSDDDAVRKIAANLGLSDFSAVLDTIPPGADELLALISVLDLVNNHPDLTFQRIVIDTAPTGHTLRFLAFPDFLDNFLEQALALRNKLQGARGMLGTVANMFVGNKKPQLNTALNTAAERINDYREKMRHLSDLFRDPDRAEFVVVTIPTVLAVEETKRLVHHLWNDGIWVRHAVVNQALPLAHTTSTNNYLSQLRKAQTCQIAFATERIADQFSLSLTLVPRFDTEVRGVYGLQALAEVAFKPSRCPSYGLLFDDNKIADSGSESLFVFVGGKGGVGKTTVSAALGVKLAAQGFKTLVLSTDPAHSLADALQLSLKGGSPLQIDQAQGELYAMEIDTEGAINDFQKLASEFVAEGRGGVGVDIARKLGLEEFASLLDNAPPGIDELVALTQVIELVKFGDFDRVVVDTAPTGHTLRLLSFPEFLDTFLGKIMRLKKRLDSAIDTLRGMLGKKDNAPDVVDKASKSVQRLRENMEELRDLVRNKDRTQFAVVTVATALAMAESERLVSSLKKDDIAVNNMIINQIISDAAAEPFVQRIVENQDKCIEDLRAAGADKNIEITEVPYFDVEVRGIHGLQAMGDSLFSPLETSS